MSKKESVYDVALANRNQKSDEGLWESPSISQAFLCLLLCFSLPPCFSLRRMLPTVQLEVIF